MKRRLTPVGLLVAAGLMLHAPDLAAAPKERHVTVNEDRLRALPAGQRAEVLRIAGRMEAILATDPASLTRDERAALRNEWRTLKKEAESHNRGGTVIYISTGGLILLIILLIILL